MGTFFFLVVMCMLHREDIFLIVKIVIIVFIFLIVKIVIIVFIMLIMLIIVWLHT